MNEKLDKLLEASDSIEDFIQKAEGILPKEQINYVKELWEDRQDKISKANLTDSHKEALSTIASYAYKKPLDEKQTYAAVIHLIEDLLVRVSVLEGQVEDLRKAHATIVNMFLGED